MKYDIYKSFVNERNRLQEVNDPKINKKYNVVKVNYPGKPFYLSFTIPLFSNKIREHYGSDIPFFLMHIKDGRVYYESSPLYGPEYDLIDKIADEGFDYINKYDKEIKHFNNKYENWLEKNTDVLGLSQLKESYDLFQEGHTIMQLAGPLTPYIEKKIEDCLKNSGLSQKELVDVILEDEKAQVNVHEDMLKNLAIACKEKNVKFSGFSDFMKDKELEQRLIDCYKDGYYLNSSYGGVRLWNLEDEYMALAKKQDNAPVKKITKDIKLDDKLAFWCDISKYFSNLRDKRKVMHQKLYYKQALILEDLSKTLHIKRSELEHLRIEQIIQNKDFEKLIHEQKKGLLYCKVKKDSFICSGKSANRLYKTTIASENGNQEIKGLPICQGKAYGRVNVILNAQEDFQHYEDQVIVTGMTSPDFLPILKQCKAIVTDRGGITCHAAIITRELNIPCITGTEVATQKLKNGDYVEVDAINGIVNKISKEFYESMKDSAVFKSPDISQDYKPITNFKAQQDPTLKKDYILRLEEICKEDISLVGGKTANLGDLYSRFPVPDGFGITTNAYKHFLGYNNLDKRIEELLYNLDINDIKSLNKSSRSIQTKIIEAIIPEDLQKLFSKHYEILKNKYVAVRSSATCEDLESASFAGQQSSFMNISGIEQVMYYTKKCWASLFNPQAIYYRDMIKYNHDQAKMSVLIQNMVDAEKSGVMFSANPVNGNNEMIIESVYGLGELLVSGKITPDYYLVDKKTLLAKDIRVNPKNIAIYLDHNTGKNIEVKLNETKALSQTLNNWEIHKISQMGIDIENYRGKQDIEWAIGKNGEFFILQSRALTGAKKV